LEKRDERKHDKPIESAKEMPIEVEITFLNKDDADSLMREYSNKVLDGKRTLEFSFLRR
jgi:hypothetical protein